MSRIPRLHAITDDARLADARFVADAAAVIEAGGADVALHLRGRATSARRLYEIAIALLPAARAAGAKLIVNDRVDVALTAGTHGVQLREDSIDVAGARALLGDAALIGVSRHAQSAADVEGADFVVFGAIWATGSHPGRAPAGIGALAEFGARAGILASGFGASGVRRQAPEAAPGSAATGSAAHGRGQAKARLVAIGGVTPDRVPEVLTAGAYGVAVLSGIWGEGPEAVVAYVSALNRHTASEA